MSFTNPRRKIAADAAGPEETLDDRIVTELRRHGPSTGAELLVALVDDNAADVMSRATAMFMSRVIGIEHDHFVLRRTR